METLVRKIDDMIPGVEKAWELLGGMDPADVCRRAPATYDSDRDEYTLRSFAATVTISVKERRVSARGAFSEVLLGRLGYFSVLSILWYMVSAQDIPLSAKLLRPANMKSGDIFFRGTHVLPLDRLAEKYGSDVQGFVERARVLGGEEQNYGDASFRLFPVPRIPVTLILWREDEEFPARVDLLFDSTCEVQAPLDILWSIAMLNVLIFM